MIKIICILLLLVQAADASELYLWKEGALTKHPPEALNELLTRDDADVLVFDLNSVREEKTDVLRIGKDVLIGFSKVVVVSASMAADIAVGIMTKGAVQGSLAKVSLDGISRMSGRNEPLEKVTRLEFVVVTKKDREVIGWTDCPDDLEQELCLEHILKERGFLSNLN